MGFVAPVGGFGGVGGVASRRRGGPWGGGQCVDRMVIWVCNTTPLGTLLVGTGPEQWIAAKRQSYVQRLDEALAAQKRGRSR